MRGDENEVLLKLKPLYYFASPFNNLSPDVQNFRQEGLVFSTSLPLLLGLFFFFFPLVDGLAPTVAQFNIYMFPSVWFLPQREVGFHVSDLPQQRFSSSF